RAKGKKPSKKKGKSKTAETAAKVEKPKPNPAKDSNNAPQKREREIEIEIPDSPPSNRKTIDQIFQELSLCGGLMRSDSPGDVRDVPWDDQVRTMASDGLSGTRDAQRGTIWEGT
ncbi:unnamed protein product, partial [Microthlaspi erraticum]